MGYTHYYYTPEVMDQKKFTELATDVRKIFKFTEDELGIKLGDWEGKPKSKPKITDVTISFNGSEEQPPGVWTTNEQLSIPWPEPGAGLNEPIPDPSANKTGKGWFAGSTLTQRVAPLNNESGKGSGSYETLEIKRDRSKQDFKQPNETGLLFSCCKTAFRPYDLPVTAVLIALKHHFPQCKISSDGHQSEWIDGMILCNNILGYGLDFELDEDD